MSAGARPDADATTVAALDAFSVKALKRAADNWDEWATTPWKERSIADVAALEGIKMAAADRRAEKLADRPGALQVVVIPQRMADPAEWERKARELDAKGRKAIDTTAGPALVEMKKP